MERATDSQTMVKLVVGMKGKVWVVGRETGLLWSSDNMIVDSGLIEIANHLNPDSYNSFKPSVIWVTDNTATLNTTDTAHDFCDMDLHERLEIDILDYYASARTIYFTAAAGVVGNFSWKRIGLLTNTQTLIGQVACNITKTVDQDVDVIYAIEVTRV